MYRIARIGKTKASVKKAKALKGLKRGDGTVWVHAVAKREGDLAEVKKTFGFHKLAIEDCVTRQQRSKIEFFDDHILVIVKDLELKGAVTVNHLGLFIGEDYLVTVSNKRLEEVDAVMGALEKSLNRHSTPDFIAYLILDKIVDNYFPVLDATEDEIEEVEREIVQNPNNRRISEKLFLVKRELLAIRKAVWPARDIFSSLSKGDTPCISRKSQVYFRDVYDHVVLVIDLVETYRELISSVLETHLSSISNSLNEVMKVLTVIATIFIPLTFVTGLYGMNFKMMPEIYWEWGYPSALALMLLIGLGMLAYFKKKGWV